MTKSPPGYNNMGAGPAESPPNPPPPSPLDYLSTHPHSHALAHPPFVLFATVIALLAYVVAQNRRHREEVRLLSLKVGQLGRDGEFVVQALQVNEERVERLGEGVDKVEDAVVEVSRAVREAIAGRGAEKARTPRRRDRDDDEVDRATVRGVTSTVAGDTVVGNVYRDQGYDTVDEDAGRHHRADTRSKYAESIYTVPEEDEDDDDWDKRTMVTEVPPSRTSKTSRRSNDRPEEKRKREEKIWSKGDWKGLEVFG